MSVTLSADDRLLLRAAPLFAGLDGETTLRLIDAAVVSEHVGGELLFSQGDPADRFFLVLAGRVNLFALSENGAQTIVEVIDQGQTFAEAAIFALESFPLAAETAAPTRLLEIPARPFLRRLAERPELPAKLLASLARWQRRLLVEVADLKGRSPIQRLGLFLLARSAEASGQTTAVRLAMSKRELASRIGITPESLSRAMARLRTVGVASQGRDIVIGDVDALRRFCTLDG
jgi:CRP-like cAMP-binding protein